ncbi:hypothetical protein MKJ04_20925 [Pontibacter sp. E15-1]|uniref:hypothetical protein n=1 Tax=Pontibacter sp. E15-1 TaxID=2919918 RepID=UPI001F4F3770|nr:hypothetical protein [Pontibacter sp. E15-1]MCJ8167317.1 hypothetical protein [Pontibacter sp. E15-1]
MEDRSPRTKQTIQHLYDTILPKLAEHLHQNLAPVTPLFADFSLERLLDTWTKDPHASHDTVVSLENGNIQRLGLRLRLEGFQKVGAEAFDISKDLLFLLDQQFYTVGPDQHTNWLEKSYLQRWEQSEYDLIAERWSEDLIDDITQRLQKLAE